MKMTGMMIVKTIETGFRIALRTSRQAIAKVALASRIMPERMPRAACLAASGRGDVGGHAASSEPAISSTYASSRLGSRTRSTLSGVWMRLISGCAVSSRRRRGSARSSRPWARGPGPSARSSRPSRSIGVEHDRALEQLRASSDRASRSSRCGRGRRRTRDRPPRPPRGSAWSGRRSCRPRCGRRAGSVHRLVAADRIEARRRLVEEQDARPMHQAADDLELALHAARVGAQRLEQVASRGRRPRPGARPAGGTRRASGGRTAGSRRCPYSATCRRMFSSAERCRSTVGFWKMIPMLGADGLRLAIEVVAVDVDGAARLGQRCGQNRDRGRLAGAVRAEEGEQLARADIEADVVDGRRRLFL